MDKKAKIIFAGDYFPGWQSSMNLRERLSYLTKSSYLSYSDRVQMINKISNIKNKLLMPYYSFNAKVNAQSPLHHLQGFLKTYDLKCINLETSLSNIGNPLPEKHYNLRCEPFYIDGLLSSHINFVVLANNHILDYGEKSVEETIKLLKKYNINYSGIKSNNQSNDQEAIIEIINGIKIGFLSYVDPAIIDPCPELYFNNNIYPYKLNSEQIIADIKRAKQTKEIANVIVNVHWGNEWSHMENKQQTDLAHKMIDSGATAVIGHHPHVIQGIEKYNNGVIAYSLGNLFMYLSDISAIRCKKSFLLEIELSDQGVEFYDIHPISHNSSGQPYLDNCINIPDLDLGNHNNQTYNDSFFFSKVEFANIYFLKGNQSFNGEWNHNFKVDRIIYNSAWRKDSAYVACGKEFSGKFLRPSAVCYSGEFNEISINFQNIKLSDKLNLYFGYPDWFDYTDYSPVEINIKLGNQTIFHDNITNSELNFIKIDAVVNENYITVTLKRNESNFICLFGIEKL